MIEIIPAIDIIDGKCVRLSQGDYDSKKVYNENPLEVAKEFEANGIKYLHRTYNGAIVARSIHRDRTRTVADTLFHRGLLFVAPVHPRFENDF